MSTSLQVIDRVHAHSKATRLDRQVLLVLARHDFGDEIRPSRRLIAEKAGCCERQVTKSLERLELLGEARRISVASAGRTNRYEVTLRCPEECTKQREHGCSLLEDERAPVYPLSGYWGSPGKGSERTPSRVNARGGRRVPRQGPRARRSDVDELAPPPVHDSDAEIELELKRAAECERSIADDETPAWLERIFSAMGDDRLQLLEDWYDAGRSTPDPVPDNVIALHG